jgi:hypothetical protein
MIGGIVVGVLLVGFLAVNLLSGGGGNEAFPSFSFHPSSPSASSSASGSPQQLPPPALSGRDPFSVPLGFGGTTSSPGTTSPTGPSSSTGTQGPTSTPTLPGGGSSTQIGGHTVVLESVNSVGGVEHAQVEVDGTVYNPPVGGRFANGDFRLVSTSGDCAGLLFGDQSFTLCARPQK